jgi:MFS family permease
MSAVSGAAADRFDRRTIIRNVSALQAVAALGLLLVDSRATLWIGFVCLCAISALGSFVGPAAQAGLPNIARNEDELAKGAILFGSLWAMLAIGAALGGLVATVFGRDVSFATNAASFAGAALLVTLIRTPMQTTLDAAAGRRERMRPIADMHEALTYARTDHALLALLASKATFALGAGIVGLLAILATEELHGGDGATGILIGVRGLGVALGPLIASKLVGTSLSRVLLLTGCAGLVFGVCYLGLSVAPVLAVAAPLAFIAHLGGGAQWTLSTYGLQRRAPDHIRGRIIAGDFGMATLIITLSNLTAGALASAIGVRPTIAAFALIGLAAGATYLLATRGLRSRLDVEAAAAAASPITT